MSAHGDVDRPSLPAMQGTLRSELRVDVLANRPESAKSTGWRKNYKASR
jgi:hypothetical protein